jgi:hypothetical protein
MKKLFKYLYAIMVFVVSLTTLILLSQETGSNEIIKIIILVYLGTVSAFGLFIIYYIYKNKI